MMSEIVCSAAAHPLPLGSHPDEGTRCCTITQGHTYLVVLTGTDPVSHRHFPWITQALSYITQAFSYITQASFLSHTGHVALSYITQPPSLTGHIHSADVSM
jgi:hypothetical protein